MRLGSWGNLFLLLIALLSKTSHADFAEDFEEFRLLTQYTFGESTHLTDRYGETDPDFNDLYPILPNLQSLRFVDSEINQHGFRRFREAVDLARTRLPRALGSEEAFLTFVEDLIETLSTRKIPNRKTWIRRSTRALHGSPEGMLGHRPDERSLLVYNQIRPLLVGKGPLYVADPFGYHAPELEPFMNFYLRERLEKLPIPIEVVVGIGRKKKKRVGFYVNFPEPRHVRPLLEELRQWLIASWDSLGRENPVRLATDAQLVMAAIHPAWNANGRLSLAFREGILHAFGLQSGLTRFRRNTIAYFGRPAEWAAEVEAGIQRLEETTTFYQSFEREFPGEEWSSVGVYPFLSERERLRRLDLYFQNAMEWRYPIQGEIADLHYLLEHDPSERVRGRIRRNLRVLSGECEWVLQTRS